MATTTAIATGAPLPPISTTSSTSTSSSSSSSIDQTLLTSVLVDWTNALIENNMNQVRRLLDKEPELLWTPIPHTLDDIDPLKEKLVQFKKLGHSFQPVCAIQFLVLYHQQQEDRRDLISSLIEESSVYDLDTRLWGECNNSLLHLTCFLDDYYLTQLLLKKGTSTHIRNDRGYTPADVTQSDNVLSLLLSTTRQDDGNDMSISASEISLEAAETAVKDHHSEHRIDEDNQQQPPHPNASRSSNSNMTAGNIKVVRPNYSTPNRFQLLKNLAEVAAAQDEKATLLDITLDRQKADGKYFKKGKVKETQQKVLTEEEEALLLDKQKRQIEVAQLVKKSAVKNNPLFMKLEKKAFTLPATSTASISNTKKPSTTSSSKSMANDKIPEATCKMEKSTNGIAIADENSGFSQHNDNKSSVCHTLPDNSNEVQDNKIADAATNESLKSKASDLATSAPTSATTDQKHTSNKLKFTMDDLMGTTTSDDNDDDMNDEDSDDDDDDKIFEQVATIHIAHRLTSSTIYKPIKIPIDDKLVLQQQQNRNYKHGPERLSHYYFNDQIEYSEDSHVAGLRDDKVSKTPSLVTTEENDDELDEEQLPPSTSSTTSSTAVVTADDAISHSNQNNTVEPLFVELNATTGLDSITVADLSTPARRPQRSDRRSLSRKHASIATISTTISGDFDSRSEKSSKHNSTVDLPLHMKRRSGSQKASWTMSMSSWAAILDREFNLSELDQEKRLLKEKQQQQQIRGLQKKEDKVLEEKSSVSSDNRTGALRKSLPLGSSKLELNESDNVDYLLHQNLINAVNCTNLITANTTSADSVLSLSSTLKLPDSDKDYRALPSFSLPSDSNKLRSANLLHLPSNIKNKTSSSAAPQIKELPNLNLSSRSVRRKPITSSFSKPNINGQQKKTTKPSPSISSSSTSAAATTTPSSTQQQSPSQQQYQKPNEIMTTIPTALPPTPTPSLSFQPSIPMGYGKLYLHVNGIQNLLLPMPKDRAYIRCVVSDGRFEYMSRYEILSPTIPFDYECVIDTHPGMLITISIHVRPDFIMKSRKPLLRLFSSKKKRKDCLSSYVNKEDGAIGQTRFALTHMLPACHEMPYLTDFHCFNAWWSSKSSFSKQKKKQNDLKEQEKDEILKVIGSFDVEMLYLPSSSTHNQQQVKLSIMIQIHGILTLTCLLYMISTFLKV
ncbi:hypothetical protein BDF20DRAFT_848438 [Mycotypha africana]|uniref:uncharacterized protein n=1 Tax=Mycotypha africana TaxID=64632 RepID=UPI002300B3BA|nr:uncharacterized protein BDF20DRAFT_848438 [Mycotypha africana]KAI8992133.1 hypothetical protein BDF20DRAFT_848438 [Mycotypha africana]